MFLEQLKIEIKLYFRNKVAIFWAFAFPIGAILGLGFIFNPSGGISLPVGVVDADSSAASMEYRHYLEKNPVLSITNGRREILLERLNRNELMSVVVIQNGFGSKIKEKKAALEIYYNPLQPQNAALLFTLFGEINTQYDEQLTDYSPSIQLIKKPVEKIPGKKRYVDFLVPGLIGFSIMSASLFGVGLVLISHRERGNLKRLAVTPLKKSVFIAANITQRLLIISLQAASMILIAYLVFDVVSTGDYLSLTFSIVLSMITFISIGFVIASVSKTVEVAQGITQVFFLAMTFLSGAFFPADNLPQIVKPVIELLPLTHCINLMRGVFVAGHSLLEHGIEILILTGWTAACFLISRKMFRWTT